MDFRQAIRAIKMLAQEDDAHDQPAPTSLDEAKQIIDGWLTAASEGGDDVTCEAIRRLGLVEAAEIYYEEWRGPVRWDQGPNNGEEGG